MNQATFVDPSSTVPVADGGNTGNGSMSTPIVSSATLTENFTVACTVPGGSGVGQFSVTGSVSGALGTATSNVEFVDADQKMRFTITAGATPWAVSDQFTFSTVAGTALNKANFDDLAHKAPTPASGYVRRFSDFFGDPSTPNQDAQGYTCVVVGTGAPSQVNEAIGVWKFITNTVLNSAVFLVGQKTITGALALNASVRRFCSRLATTEASGNTNKRFIAGLGDTLTDLTNYNAAGAAKGVFFRVEAGGATANIFAVCKNGAATETTVDTGVADSTTFREAEIRVTSSSAQFFLDEVLVATITTNIPNVALASLVGLKTLDTVLKDAAVDDLYEFHRRI